MTASGLGPRTTWFSNDHSTIWPNGPIDWGVFWVHICAVHLTVCSCHVSYAFQSESTFYSCLNVKEFLARMIREIWSLTDCTLTGTLNHLFRKQTLTHLAKLAKRLACVLSSYLYGAFDCMYFSCHVHVSERIHCSVVVWMSRNSLLEEGAKFEVYCNWTATLCHLVHKWTLNNLARLAKWLRGVLSSYLYGAFDCMFLSFQLRVSEWIHTV